MTLEDAKKSSRLWYLAPVFLGLVGGVIAYFILRKDDHKLAKRCLLVGILFTIIPFAVGIFVVVSVDLPDSSVGQYYTDLSPIQQELMNDYVGLAHDPDRTVNVISKVLLSNNTGNLSLDEYSDYETPEEMGNRFQTIMWELDRISNISDEIVVIDYLNDSILDLQNQTNILILNDTTKQRLLSILESAKQNSQISEIKALSINADEANETIANTEFYIENYIDELNVIMNIENVDILLTKAKQISIDSKKRDVEVVELISENSLFFTSKIIDQLENYVYETRLITQKMRDLGFDITISAEHEDHMTGTMETASETLPNTQSTENP